MAQHPRRATPVVCYWENSQAEPWRQFKLPNIFLCKYISLCFKGKTLRPWWEHPGCRSAWWWSAQPCVGPESQPCVGPEWVSPGSVLSQYAAQIPPPVSFIHHSIIYLRNPKISSLNPSLLLNTTLPHCFELLAGAICGLLPTRASQELLHIPSMKSCKQKTVPTLIHSFPHHLKPPQCQPSLLLFNPMPFAWISSLFANQ